MMLLYSQVKPILASSGKQKPFFVDRRHFSMSVSVKLTL